MGGGGGEVQKEYSRKGKLNLKKIIMQRLKTIHTREMFSKKEQVARKFLTLSRIFLLVRPLFSCIHVEHL